MEPTNHQEWIDRFLRNELSDKDKEVFMEKIKDDSSFAKEFNLQSIIAKGIKSEGNRDLRNRFQKIQKELGEPAQDKTPNKFRLIPILLATAATVAILFFAYNHFTSSPTNDEIFTEFFQPYDASFNTRSTQLGELKSLAENAYRSEEYEKAIPHLKKIVQSEPENIAAKLALGNSYMELDNFDSAENLLSEIINSNDELFMDQANWYLALTYLKSGDLNKCKKILQILNKKENADFQKEAQKLLEKILK